MTTNKNEERENPCSSCDSNSMEECLLIRHCKYWVTKKEKDDES